MTISTLYCDNTTISDSALATNPVYGKWDPDNGFCLEPSMSVVTTVSRVAIINSKKVVLEWRVSRVNGFNPRELISEKDYTTPYMWYWFEWGKAVPPCIIVDDQLFINRHDWEEAFIESFTEAAYKDGYEEQVKYDNDNTPHPWSMPWLVENNFDFDRCPEAAGLDWWLSVKEEFISLIKDEGFCSHKIGSQL